MPEISVIIPVYNVEKYLKRCIDSVLSQSFSDLEIILVDDGSTDSSGKICDDYEKKDKRIKVIHKKNGGLSDARNSGLAMASGEYIGFVDSDDYIEPDMYEYLYNNIIKESADISMCEFFHCYNNKKISINEKEIYKVTDSIEAIYIVLESRITSVTVVNKLFKHKLFNDLYFRVGKTAEDAFIIIDLLSKIERAVISNKQKYYYFHRADSITTRNFNQRDFDAVEAYEYNYKRALQISSELEPVAKMRRCWSRFYVLDKMMICDGKYNKEKQNEYVSFLRKNGMFIIRNDVFTKSRRFAFIFLYINVWLYRKMVRYNAEKNKSQFD